jgi:hypothetical protein
MKYLITESQLDRAVFKYLDNQDFIRIKKMGWINFVNSIDDESAKIRYDEKASWCYINYDLITEISSFFSLRESNSEEIIGHWVKNTLKMKVINTFTIYSETFFIFE